MAAPVKLFTGDVPPPEAVTPEAMAALQAWFLAWVEEFALPDNEDEAIPREELEAVGYFAPPTVDDLSDALKEAVEFRWNKAWAAIKERRKARLHEDKAKARKVEQLRAKLARLEGRGE